MTTEPRRKVYLSGYTKNGAVLRIRTAAEYSYLVLHEGELGRRQFTRHYHLDTAFKASRPGDTIIGLTTATIHSGGPYVWVNLDGRWRTFPRCYACDKPGLRFSTDFSGTKRPACAGRHRDPERTTP